MRQLQLSSSALDFLFALDAKQFKQVVRKLFGLLADPSPNDSIKLKGTDERRCDVGEYRIIYSFDATTVSAFAIGKRNDDEVYRDARRKR